MICRTGVGDIIECQNCLIRPNGDSSKASSTPADRLSKRKIIDQSEIRSTEGDLVQLVQQAKSICVLNNQSVNLIHRLFIAVVFSSNATEYILCL